MVKDIGNSIDFKFFYHVINTALIMIVIQILTKYVFINFENKQTAILLISTMVFFIINFIEDLFGIKKILKELYVVEMNKKLSSKIKFFVVYSLILILIFYISMLSS